MNLEDNLTEAQILDKIWTELEGLNRERGKHENKIYMWRNNTGAANYEDSTRRKGRRFIKYGHVGSGDLVGSIHGTFVSIEVKSKTGRVRPSQLAYMEKITDTGGVAFVARSWKEVKERLGL